MLSAPRIESNHYQITLNWTLEKRPWARLELRAKLFFPSLGCKSSSREMGSRIDGPCEDFACQDRQSPAPAVDAAARLWRQKSHNACQLNVNWRRAELELEFRARESCTTSCLECVHRAVGAGEDDVRRWRRRSRSHASIARSGAKDWPQKRLRRSARSTNEYWLSVGLKVTSTPASWFWTSKSVSIGCFTFGLAATWKCM